MLNEGGTQCWLMATSMKEIKIYELSSAHLLNLGLDDEVLGEACGGTHSTKVEDVMEVGPCGMTDQYDLYFPEGQAGRPRVTLCSPNLTEHIIKDITNDWWRSWWSPHRCHLFRWRHKLILEISIEYNRLHHILSGKKRDETRAGTLLRQTWLIP